MLLNIFYLIIVLYLVGVLFYQVKKTKLNSMFIINVFMLMYYALPFYLYTLPDGPYKMEFYQPSWAGLLSILIFYSITCIAYNTPKTSLISFHYYIPNEQKFVKRIAVAVLVFSSILFLLYCALYGGIGEMMSNIYSIREGEIESNNKSLEFLSKLYNVVIYAPVLLIPYWHYSSKKSIIKRWLIVVSIVIAFVIKLSTGSRGAFLTFFVMFVLGSIFTNKNMVREKKIAGNDGNLEKYVFILIVSVFALVVLRPLLFFVSNLNSHDMAYAMDILQSQLMGSGGSYSIASFRDFIGGLLNSFSHYAASLEMSIYKVYSGNHACNYMLEFFVMFQSVIPSKLIGIAKMDDITAYNTLYFNNVGLGYIPPGIIGSAIYSGGIVWVAFYGFLVGYIGKKFDIFYCRIKDNIEFSGYYYAALLFLFYGFAASGDFSSQFSKNFATFLFVIFVYINLRKRNVR